MWDQEQQQSFDELKKLLASAETLCYFDKNAHTKVIADASPVGLGAVLVQQQGEELRVIRELKQPRRRRQQKPHKFAYLTIQNSIFARFARAFLIF